MSAPTYQDLLSFITASWHSLEAQASRNMRACLQNWIDFHGVGWEAEIGQELGMDFNAQLERFSKYLNDKFRPTTTESKKSLLRKVRVQYREFLNSQGLPPVFRDALKHLMARKGINTFELTKQTDLQPQKVYNWVNGTSVPNKQSLPSIRKIEQYFELPKGVLTHWIVDNRLERIKKKRRNVTGFGKRNSILTNSRYRYSELPQHIDSEWQRFVKYKTSAYNQSGLKRKTAWRDKQGKGSPSVYREMLRSFFGYLVLAPSDDILLSGKGISEDNLSFSMLTDSELLLDYIEFRKIRSGNKYTNETLNFLNFCKSCMQKGWGYFWQQQECGINLISLHPKRYCSLIISKAKEYALKMDNLEKIENDETVNERDYTNSFSFEYIWKYWCEYNKEVILSVANELEYNNHIQQGRVVTEPIADILALQHPMQALVEMAATMERELPHPSRKIKYAVAFRNLLLVKMLTSNPLRRSHFCIMTWNIHNTGNLYQTSMGEWRLRFSASDFKNERGAANKDYDVPMREKLWPYIEEYLFKCRENLLGHDKCEYVFRPFPTSKSLEREALSMKSATLTELMRTQITLAFSPGNFGFGFHSFRHIVATEYLRNNPNGFQVVADILHNKLATVMKNYAHLEVADGMKFFYAYLEKEFPGA